MYFLLSEVAGLKSAMRNLLSSRAGVAVGPDPEAVEKWSGTRFYLKTRATEESEVRFLYLEGKWNGDQLSLTTTLVAPGIPTTTRSEKSETGDETTTVIDGHPDARAPITFLLERGLVGDFEARCKSGASK